MFTKINIKIFLLSVISFCFLNVTLSQTNKSVTDFLGIPGPLLFNTKSYILNWSAHPNTNYYKQAPGRTNEHDHYREYKKYNQSGDYQPSNQSTIQQQYRSYQGNIPPKKMKLTSNYIGQTT